MIMQFCIDRQARCGLVESADPAFELQHGASVHKAVQNSSGHGGVTQVSACAWNPLDLMILGQACD